MAAPRIAPTALLAGGRQGPAGMPGVNAVENDVAVAAYMANPETSTNSATVDLIKTVAASGTTGEVKLVTASTTNLSAPRPSWAGAVHWLVNAGDPDPTNKIPGDIVSEVTSTAYPPNLLWLDYFARAANAASLGTTQVGAKAWSQLASSDGVLGVSGNSAMVTAGTGGTITAWVNAGVARTRFIGKITAQSSGQAGLIFRYVDANNYMVLSRSASTAPFYYRLVRRANGTSSTILTTATVMAAGDSFDIDDRILGQLKIKINGATIYDQLVNTTPSIADSGGTTLESATRQGLYVASGAARGIAYDNLEVYSAA